MGDEAVTVARVALIRYLDLFDRLPREWLRVAATASAGHDPYEMERRGALTRRQARTARRATLLRSYAAD